MQRQLHLRVAMSIVAAALVIGAFSSFVFYFRTYTKELAAAQHLMQQLVATVRGGAAVGAYMDNPDIADKVVQSLIRQDLIAGVAFNTHEGLRRARVKDFINQDSELQWKHFPLFDPFIPDKKIGELVVLPNRRFIQEQARATAREQAILLGLHTLLMALLVMSLVHRQFSRPLQKLARGLHAIEPDSETRLAKPRGHAHDEVGSLVADINALLDAVRQSLHTERTLRTKTELLERQFRLIFERASAGILLMSKEGRLFTANPALAALIEPAEIAQGTDVPEWFADPEEVYELLHEVRHSSVPLERDLELREATDGSVRWLHSLFSTVTDDSGEVLIEVMINDITERTQREQRIRFEADHDPLTYLFNRRAGELALAEGIAKAARVGIGYTVLLVDLDKFKPVNDTYGHDAGDHVLTTVAERLRHTLRKEDLIIRWGGDEFLVAFSSQEGDTAIVGVAEKLVHLLNAPIRLEHGEFCQVGASIGIAVFPEHGEDMETLINNADVAMYNIKGAGRNGLCLYHPQPHKRIVWRLHDAGDLTQDAHAGEEDVETILLVDDQQENLQILLAFLRRHQYRLLTARDGASALEIAETHTPDIILLDVMMPDINGFEVCRKLKENTKVREIPVLFMTALIESGDKLKGFAAGGVDYLTKPLNSKEVLARVRTHIGLYRMQRELRRKNSELGTQNAQLDAFTYTVAHDLKAPLNTLSGVADLIEFAVEKRELGEFRLHLELLRNVIHKSADIIEALLLLAGTSGHRRVNIEPFDMSFVVRKTLENLHAQLEQYQAQVVVAESWPFVSGYPAWVEIIWRNYISNALKFGDKPPLVELGMDEAEEFVRFWVKDNGPGLTSEQQSKLFVPFSRVHTDRAEDHGLGLCIVKNIATRLHGSVGVESTPGEGCRFYFTLPR